MSAGEPADDGRMTAATPGMRSVAPGLYLAGGAAPDNIARLAVQLGLASDHQVDDDGGLAINFGDVIMRLTTGTAAAARLAAEARATPPLGIGGVMLDDPVPSQLVGLALAKPRMGDDSRAAALVSVQRQCAAAALLAAATGHRRLYWPPAGLWSPTDALVEAISATEDQRLPPVLHLVAFQTTDAAGAMARTRTRGLAYFCGIECALDHPAELSAEAAVRRLARLAVHAMVVGPLTPGATVAGLEPGETLDVRPHETQPVPTVVVRLKQARS